jgi:flagellar M-ring protein FliF
MAKDSLFVNDEEPAKGVRRLRLKANRPLAPGTVKGIAGLVSASVESLRPESVTILDTFGRFLSRRPPKTRRTAGGAAQFERQQQVERDMATRVIALLEPAVGAGRVRVNVSAQLNAISRSNRRALRSDERRPQPDDLDGNRNRRHLRPVASRRARESAAGLSTSTANAGAATPADPAAHAATPAPGSLRAAVTRRTLVGNDELRGQPHHDAHGDGARAGLAPVAGRDHRRPACSAKGRR